MEKFPKIAPAPEDIAESAGGDGGDGPVPPNDPKEVDLREPENIRDEVITAYLPDGTMIHGTREECHNAVMDYLDNIS